MEKGGFEINLDDIPGNDGLIVDEKKEEKVPEVKAEEKVEQGKTEDPKDGLLIVDVPAEEVEDEDDGQETEEEKKAKEEKESKSGEDAGETQETESPSFLHATALRDKGVLPHLDLDTLKDKSDKEIIDATIWATQEEIEDGVKSIVDQQDVAYQEFVEMVDSGADLNEYARIKASQKRFDGLTDEKLEADKEIQKALVAEDMRDRGLEDDDIIENLKDLEGEDKEDKLFSKAKTARGKINKRDEARQKKVTADAEKQKEDAEKQQKEVMGKIDSSLEKIKEIIPGIPVSKKEKDIIKRLMTVPVGYEGNVPVSRAQEIRSKDPIAYETKLAYMIAIGLFDDEPKWERVKKRMESDATVKLLGKLNDGKKTPVGKPAKAAPKDEEVDGKMQMPFAT